MLSFALMLFLLRNWMNCSLSSLANTEEPIATAAVEPVSFLIKLLRDDSLAYFIPVFYKRFM
jgi:hypothetical protein